MNDLCSLEALDFRNVTRRDTRSHLGVTLVLTTA